MFEEIKKQNPDFPLLSVTDKHFKEYGQIISNVDCTELLEALEKKEIPSEGNIYVASDPELESLEVAETFRLENFGNLPIQIGYCNGNSMKLNALEYHKSPELNISSEDIILFLGKTLDIDNDEYDTQNVVAFYLPKNILVELYGTTMHFAPCKTSPKGFKTIVVLLKETNEDFSEEDLDKVKSKSLFKINKWLLCHPENEVMIDRGAYVGLKGTNYEIK